MTLISENNTNHRPSFQIYQEGLGFVSKPVQKAVALTSQFSGRDPVSVSSRQATFHLSDKLLGPMHFGSDCSVPTHMHARTPARARTHTHTHTHRTV